MALVKVLSDKTEAELVRTLQHVQAAMARAEAVLARVERIVHAVSSVEGVK